MKAKNFIFFWVSDATEIDNFKAKYPDITCNVDVIKVKVMNEKKERKRKLERELSYIDAVSNNFFFL